MKKRRLPQVVETVKEEQEEESPQRNSDDDLNDILNMKPGYFRENLMKGVIRDENTKPTIPQRSEDEFKSPKK